jgi:BirA family transcriptional regulator, biotin operon repressor / biotin---[acetyl-CoA-carboxylase] ligase
VRVTEPETSRPPLDLTVVADAVAYWRVEVVEETPSTNADLAQRARAGEDAGLVLVAEHQAAGRGRLDRTWESPPRAGLTFSLLLRPNLDPSQWPWLPLAAGVATARAVRRLTDLRAGLKWPNDLLVGGAKAVGILVERVETPAGPAAVVGIGINVTTTREELPVPEATSLAIEGAYVDRATLLRAVLGEIPLAMEDLGQTRGAYLELCETVGRAVAVSLPSGKDLQGRAVGIDVDGRLEVETDAGRVAVGAGDVVHVR